MSENFDQIDQIFDDIEDKKKKQKKIWSQAIISFLVIAIIAVGSLLVFQVILSEPGDSSGQNTADNKPAQPGKLASALTNLAGFRIPKDKLPESINILILGIAGVPNPGSQLTDSIVVVHFKPKENGLVAFSLPRDFLVKIPGRSSSSKINSLYYSTGIEGVKQKIQDITGLSIDHYAVVNLKIVEEIIDLIDGLNIYVPKDIYDPYYPSPYRGYQVFSIKAGWRYLDGATALKYMRTRYTSPGGDFDRMARQQQMLRAIKQKVFSLDPLWDFDTYLKIYDSLQNRLTTDLTLNDIKLIWQLGNDLDINNIYTTTIDRQNTNLVVGSMINQGETPVSVVLPRAGYENYSAIKAYLSELLNR